MTFSAKPDNNESSISESGDTFFFVLRLNDIVNTMSANVSPAGATSHHKVSGHNRPVSEKSFKCRFAGGHS